MQSSRPSTMGLPYLVPFFTQHKSFFNSSRAMENMDEAQFSPRKTTTRMNCCVPQCSSVACLNPELRFHSFPSEGEFVFVENKFNVREKCDRRKAWSRILRIGKPISKNMFVCSRHFLKSDYILPDIPAKIRYLKRTAVPSLNLPISSTDKWKEWQGGDNTKRYRQRGAIEKKVSLCDTDEESDGFTVRIEPEVLVEQQETPQDCSRDIVAAETLIRLAESSSPQ
ncbi:uncharacterized protein LOC124168056 [Ischnura elegans]|uniref:uncharacterized protein LOC124168056 n=1 Tax=Ischnura elegans TaxID=197161 RepID=UPI001ED8A8C6|nr:uncharacterized protein LOC124168056 [Ischnura elegans]